VEGLSPSEFTEGLSPSTDFDFRSFGLAGERFSCAKGESFAGMSGEISSRDAHSFKALAGSSQTVGATEVKKGLKNLSKNNK
jgi:hypothetical protein